MRKKDIYTWVVHASFQDELTGKGNRTALYRNGEKIYSGWADGEGIKIARSIVGARSVPEIHLTSLPDTIHPRYWSEP